jgi:hypothetical protein
VGIMALVAANAQAALTAIPALAMIRRRRTD